MDGSFLAQLERGGARPLLIPYNSLILTNQNTTLLERKLMSKANLESLLNKRAVLLDGGMGTEFQSRGVPAGTHPDLLNLTDPAIVKAVIKSYVDAGSDVVLTNTFGSTRFVLEKHGEADKLAEINFRAAQIAREVADETTDHEVFVFGDLGPTGVMLVLGDVPESAIYDAYYEQIAALKKGGVDGVAVETSSDPQEAAQAVKAAKDQGLFVAVTATFDSGKNKDRTMMGTTPEKFIEVVEAAGADAVGSNCGRGIEGFPPLCQRMRAVTQLPLWMKSNAGLPQTVDGVTTYAQTPQDFAEKAIKLIDEGAKFIGGCCGTNPDFIRELRKLIG